MADPKIPDHKLFKQGEVFGRASTTDEKITDIAPDYRGHGATPQEKADDNKAWISKGHPDLPDAADAKPQPDTYAQEVNKRLGAFASVKDKVADGVETAMDKMSGSTDTKNSSGSAFSQYTNAAWEKISAMKPTIGAQQQEKPAVESTLNERMSEISEKGHHDANAAAEKAKESMPSLPDVAEKVHILDAGGDDVLKILADGGSTQGDPLKANMRVTTEMLA